MSTRKTGYVLTSLGGVAILGSLLVDLVQQGKSGFGASQILGLEIGIFLLLGGVFLAYFYPSRRIDLRQGLLAGLDRLFHWPVSVWVVAGFLVTYFFFFLTPVFFNAERTMLFFHRFLPSYNPIGFDIRAVVDYTHNWLVSNQSPYADRFIAYPPVALLLFTSLILLGYPAYYYFITFVTLLFYLGSTWLVPWRSSQPGNRSLILMLFALGMFSYGFQFELERGQSNIIAFSLALIAVYMYHARDDSNFFAYILFTLGVQLKIYPAILIVMFVKDWRDWRGNAKRIGGLLMLNFALLFILGPYMFGDFLGALRSQQFTAEGSWVGSHALKGYVYYLASEDFHLAGPRIQALLQHYRGGIELALLATLGLCLASVLAVSYLRGRTGLNPYLLVICTICAMVIPSISNDYKLPILIAPMAILWSNLTMPVHRLKKVLAILLILLTSLAYWSTQYPPGIKPELLARNFPALFVIAVAAAILSFVAPWDPAVSPPRKTDVPPQA